jgi:hypothetical protein
MDARIEAEAAVVTLSFSPTVTVVTTIVVDDLVEMLTSLFNPASVLAPLLNQSNSISAVPDHILERKVSGLALVG